MRHCMWTGRFPAQARRASTPWRGAKEVSGVALVVAQEVPTSSSMAVPHGPAGVGTARRRMREQLRRGGVPDPVVDDAVLILSELLSNSCRHGRPLDAAEIGEGAVRAAWRVDAHGALTVEVTDGGGPTRPVPSTPSVTARGGRGLNIISTLAQDWGVRDSTSGEVTVWVLVAGAPPCHEGGTARVTGRRDDPAGPSLPRVNGARHARVAGAGSRPGAGAAPLMGDPGFLDAYEDVD
ncbi:ATP-binding protein [Streptomyces roseolilacinus]|uniref:ATP-binding protein n=1 Tax=Streptomyces roseolilacinus TaxID=66904 RepID=UPI001E5A96C5|nr:ATP-binding protein [Streptomyces roseolilacinus]